jgi:hypothetical protein
MPSTTTATARCANANCVVCGNGATHQDASRVNTARRPGEMRLPTTYLPSTHGQLLHILNGRYVISRDDSPTVYIQLYTITSGNMNNHRIIKILNEDTGEYESAASLMTDGTVWAWNRYRGGHFRGSVEHRMINQAFWFLANNPTYGPRSMFTASAGVNVNRSLVNRRCNGCNDTLTQHDSASHCTRCVWDRPNVIGAMAHQDVMRLRTVYRDRGYVRPIGVTQERPARASQRRPLFMDLESEYGTPVRDRPRVEPDPPRMSEINSSEVM